MTQQMSEDEIRRKAEKRVEEKLGFKIHLTFYLAVNFILFLIWLFIGLFADAGWFPWFLFPLVGWGIGVFFHSWGVYRGDRFDERREAMVQKEMERMKGGPQGPVN